MKQILIIGAAALAGCATLTNDANVPIAFSMSDGSEAECNMFNKRGNWSVEVPATAMIRRSDDTLRYSCTSEDGRTATGSIDSTVGAKIVASAIFIDFGITDAITDKHRDYPPSYVIPIKSNSHLDRAAAIPSSKSGRPSKSDGVEYQPMNLAQVKGVADAMSCEKSVSFLKEDAGAENWLLDCGDGESLVVKCKDETCAVVQSRG